MTGVGIGALTRNQTVAVTVTLIWILTIGDPSGERV
jgi:hypothetical protein